MSQSAYTKPMSKNRIVGSANIVGAGEVIIPLNKDFLTTEYQLSIAATQAYAIAPTGVGNAAAMVQKIVLETNRGQVIVADGESLSELSSYTEQMKPNDRYALGVTSTMLTVIDVHMENDGAIHDLLTAIDTVDHPDLKLRVTLIDPDAAGVFTGGTTPGAFSFTVKARDNSIPALSQIGKQLTVRDVDPLSGQVFEAENDYAGIATLVHHITTQTRVGNTTGAQQPVRLLSAGNLLRFLQFVVFDTTGAQPVRSNNIISNIRLVVAGEEVRIGHFHDFQSDNETARGMSRLNSGVCVLDFGDDEESFLDMSDSKEALLYIDVDAAAPAGWEIRISEDYTAQA